jgi:restriction system protein
MATWLLASKALEVLPATETVLLHDNADRVGETRKSTSHELTPDRRQSKKTLSFDELRMSIGRTVSGYDDLTDAEKKAILNKRECAQYPEPVDYGLSHDDLTLHNVFPLHPDERRYKEGERWWGRFLARGERGYKAAAAGAAFWLLLIGTLAATGKGNENRTMAIILLGLGSACVLYAIVPSAVIGYQRRKTNPGVVAFNEALRLHRLYEIAAYDAAQEQLKRKRSYWEGLNGYEFERETAEVLKKHHFNTAVTRGSGDGGVDINAARGGLSGVIQCKAHVASVGPHIVRDLWGVIHHLKADFGIIVSKGGFTKGAIDFARDKPIYFLDTDDLVAMQEGRDVLAKAFSA